MRPATDLCQVHAGRSQSVAHLADVSLTGSYTARPRIARRTTEAAQSSPIGRPAR